MYRTSCAALALGALVLCTTAWAQTVTSVTLNPATVRGGIATTATVSLSAPAPSEGVAVRLFSLNPAVITGPDVVTVPGGQSAATFVLTPFPVDTATSTFIGAVSPDGAIRVARMTVTEGPPWRTRIAVLRPGPNTWYIRKDGGASVPVQFGTSVDTPVPADYLGYGLVPNAVGATQIAVYRPPTGDWFINSTSGTIQLHFGELGDLPAPADYFGQGRAQIAIFRGDAGQFHIRNDNSTITVVSFGEQNDIPVPGNYLGIGHAQLAVYRPSSQEWFIRSDSGDFSRNKFGETGDLPVPGDYLGLGRLQLATYRPSEEAWYIRSDNGDFTRVNVDVPGGVSAAGAAFVPGDVPVPGDYLGLGRTQMAIFRRSTAEWFIRLDSGSLLRVQFGGPGDRPVPSAYSAAALP